MNVSNFISLSQLTTYITIKHDYTFHTKVLIKCEFKVII
jgi:hypothetical protein